jgi:hypothetical protein
MLKEDIPSDWGSRVSDHAKVLGIEEDLALQDKHNLETFRLQVRNSLERYLCNKTT